MNAYVEEFNNLARYAPNDVSTNAARQEKFLEGLDDELSIQLTVATFNNFQELIDKAIVLEGKFQRVENRNRKARDTEFNPGGPRKHHNSSASSKYYDSGVDIYNGHNHDGHNHHNNNGHNHNAQRNGNNDHDLSTPTKKDLSQLLCYRCRNPGHYSTNCPELKKINYDNGNSGDKEIDLF